LIGVSNNAELSGQSSCLYAPNKYILSSASYSPGIAYSFTPGADLLSSWTLREVTGFQGELASNGGSDYT
jgi:hypothetical protein